MSSKTEVKTKLSTALDTATIIAFEGMDGSGKTSLATSFPNLLSKLHEIKELQLCRPIKVFQTHVFEHTPEAIAYMQNMKAGNLSELEIGLGALYNSHRFLNSALPELAKQYDVILIDRCRASFLAYQIYGAGLDRLRDTYDYILEQELLSNVTPDYIYLKTELKETEKLIKKRNVKKDHYDNKKSEFKKRMKQGYEEFFNSPNFNFAKKTTIIEPAKIAKINGEGLDIFISTAWDIFLENYVDQIVTNVNKRFVLEELTGGTRQIVRKISASDTVE